jgi:hypothetical protein
MMPLALLRRHWLPVLLLAIAAGIVWNTVALDADRDTQRARADAAELILRGSIDAAGAVNGWPATQRLKAEQLPLQIQLYGKALDAVRRKTAEAKTADLNHARAVEARDIEIMKEQQDALTTKLAAELRRADDYARRLRSQAGATGSDPGRGGAAGVSAIADAAGAPDRAGQAALLDGDIRICTENTVKAEGWAEFWARVFADPR